MRVLSVTWNGNQDITKIKFSDDFLSSNWTVKTDVLKDMIEELSCMYNGLLTPQGMQELIDQEPTKE